MKNGCRNALNPPFGSHDGFYKTYKVKWCFKKKINRLNMMKYRVIKANTPLNSVITIHHSIQYRCTRFDITYYEYLVRVNKMSEGVIMYVPQK